MGQGKGTNAKPNDAQIAHIAYTAGALDIAAGKQAVAKTSNPKVKSFAEEWCATTRATRVTERMLARLAL